MENIILNDCSIILLFFVNILSDKNGYYNGQIKLTYNIQNQGEGLSGSGKWCDISITDGGNAYKTEIVKRVPREVLGKLKRGWIDQMGKFEKDTANDA